MNMVSLEKSNATETSQQMNPLDFLLSDSDGEDTVSLIRVED